jgi:hypothetical protein
MAKSNVVTLADLKAAKAANFDIGYNKAMEHGVKYIVPTVARVHGYMAGQVVVTKVVIGKA